MINILGPLLVGGEELRQNLVGLGHVLMEGEWEEGEEGWQNMDGNPPGKKSDLFK